MDYFVLRFDHGYEKADFVALNAVASKKLTPWWKRGTGVIMLLAALFLLFGGVAMLGDPEVRGSGIVAVLMGVAFILLFVFKNRVNAWASRRNTAKIKNLTIKFSDTTLTEKNEQALVQMPYTSFTRVLYYKKRYFLFVDKRRAYILPEGHFAVGDPRDFADFIAQKTGHPVEYV